LTNQRSKLGAAFERVLDHPRLGLWLALAAVLLSSSSLFLGFHLDDHVGRYVYSNLDGAKRLFQLYEGGYGLATGNPDETHWQIEHGWAPWWVYDHLLIRLFRPIGMLTHWIDFRLFPDSAWLMHLHNLVWLALLVLAATRMYRIAMGVTVGGLAALLFAFDHSHGFGVGYICNRHALITALLGMLCLGEHLRAHETKRRSALVFAYVLYAIAIGSGESAVAVCGYLFAHALCVEQGPLLRRALRFLPYAVITVIWRAAYTRAGYGAFGSGLYIDPGREPIVYLIALITRAPVLLLGQFLAPPAELYSVAAPAIARVIMIAAMLFTLALLLGLWPLLRRDRLSRFWFLGLLASLVPAASTYPHNRQLLFTSFGAMALLAQLWQLHAPPLGAAIAPAAKGVMRFSRELAGLLFFVHVVASPLALPITTFGIAWTSRLDRSPAAITDEIADRDAVFITAPDYFAVKLVQLQRRIEKQPLAKHWRALAFGPEHITVQRTGPATLELDWAEGILSTPFMELYRDRRVPMMIGERIQLEGMAIEVLELTADQRARKVRFSFDAPLEDPKWKFYYWDNGRFEPFAQLAVGAERALPPALLEFGL
jgi:hypothetical protein